MQTNKRTWALITSIIITTISYWIILILQEPIFRKIPDYYWHAMRLIDKPLPMMWLFIPLTVLTLIIIRFVLKNTSRTILNLSLLILLGWTVQISFGFSEGNGIDGIRSRMVNTGHAEFAKISAGMNDHYRIITDYESFLMANQDIKYANAKPPGHLLFYMVTQQISNLFYPKSEPMSKFNRLTTFSSYVYPLVSYLVLIPLFFLSRHFLDEKKSFFVCLLYIFIPSTALITLHLDQVIYPVLFVTTLYLSLLSATKNKPILPILAGASVYLSIFVSFSLLPLAIFAPFSLIAFSIDWNGKSLRTRKIVMKLGWFMLGVLTFFLLFKYTINYDIFLRYSNAMIFHQQWKIWNNSLNNMILFEALNIIEFACWLGIPLLFLSFSNMGNSIMNLIRRKIANEDILPLLFASLFILLGLFGKTKGEIHRLWIFIVPFICLFVVSEIDKRFKSKSDLVFGSLLAMQFAGMIIIKRYQDFW